MNYDQIDAQITRGEDSVVELTSSSLVILLSALSLIEPAYLWHNNGVELSVAQLDEVDDWTAKAGLELLTAYECEECPTVTVDCWTLSETQGTNGETTDAGLDYVPFNTAAAANEGNVALAENELNFTPDAGVYFVTGIVSSWSQGRGMVVLYNQTEDEFTIYGMNRYSDHDRSFAGVVVANGTDYFQAVVINAESGRRGLSCNSAGIPEVYATIEWQKLS